MAPSTRKPAATARKTPAAAPAATAAPAGDLWHAGLGALAKAQAEGSKAFDTLMQQGLALHSQTQALAREHLSHAAQHMEEAISAAAPAPGAWNPLESVFEQRVARALQALGQPDAAALAALQARVAALEQALAALSAAQGAAAPRAPRPARTARPAAKPTPAPPPTRAASAATRRGRA